MRLLFALLVTLAVTACSGTGTSTPVAPSSSPSTAASITGTWTGSSHDTTGQEGMGWTVTQNGNGLTGTMTLSDAGRGMMGNGAMTGTVNGQTITFHTNMATGGFSGMMSSCAMAMDGQATMSADGHTLTGTYTGNLSGMMSGGMMGQSCGGAMNGGQFTLTR